MGPFVFSDIGRPRGFRGYVEHSKSNNCSYWYSFLTCFLQQKIYYALPYYYNIQSGLVINHIPQVAYLTPFLRKNTILVHFHYLLDSWRGSFN